MYLTLPRAAACLLAGALLAIPAPRGMAQALPPHAWLFGSWTGGLFPVPDNGLPARLCLAQPTVIFTRDLVLRTSLTDPTYSQREVETARTGPGGTEFRFAPAGPGTGGLLGLGAAPPPAGFGCEDPNVLHVQRKSDNEITFPGCVDFPYPLVRCH